MVRHRGIEPRVFDLSDRCSTVELVAYGTGDWIRTSINRFGDDHPTVGRLPQRRYTGIPRESQVRGGAILLSCRNKNDPANDIRKTK